jgi:choice-of-anchor B domain-containing protein
MKKTLIFCIALCVLTTFVNYAQTNVDLVGSLNPYPSIGYNDIWAYVDGTGIEYALLGTRHGTSIIRLDNPVSPQEVAFIPGPPSVWRDIKVHGNYAYTVTEQTGSGQGLQIIDLSNLPTSAALVNTVDTWFSRAHNIFIDNGYAYVIGTGGGGGMHILDLTDPVNPTRTFYYTASNYIHDVYVWNDTVVACAEDSYDLVDVSDKSNPQLISESAMIPNIYAHSGWMTEDKRYFYGTEEFNSVDITVWDLQDRTSWDLVVPSWQTGSNATVHNLFILGNYAHVSYYTDGYVILDISDPLNPFLAGEYSTSNMWGCYPYLPSGLTICSDMDDGLYVFQFTLTVVPVELTSFTATINESDIILDWKTVTETNNLGFEIQKRFGSIYASIGFIKGHGTTTEPQHYSFTDRNLSPATYYYRLKQVDLDGNVEYSDEVEVDLNPAKFILNQNYPNPFNPSTKISFNLPADGFTSLIIYSALGEEVSRVMNDFMQAGAHTVSFDASNLPSGMYLAKLESGNNVQTIKMSLLK